MDVGSCVYCTSSKLLFGQVFSIHYLKLTKTHKLTNLEMAGEKPSQIHWLVMMET